MDNYETIMQCIKESDYTYAICVWPKASDIKLRTAVEEKIKDFCNIIYKTEMSFNSRSFYNFIIQFKEKRINIAKINSFNRYKLIRIYWKKGKSTLIYFITVSDFEIYKNLEKEIKSELLLEDNLVYFTHSYNETLLISGIVLNRNSMDLIIKGNPSKYATLNILIENFKHEVIKEEKNLNDFIVDSSAVMGLYGLREIHDLDYLTFTENYLDSNINSIEEHSAYLKYHQKSLNELLYDSDNYLFYNSVKFISLHQAKQFKLNRAEKKDLNDVRLINSFYQNDIDLFCFIYKTKSSIKYILNRIKIKIRKHLL